MPKRTYKADPDQLDLLGDRSKQFELMEEFEFCGTPSQVAMLCKLFIAVGKFNKKVIEIETLARRCSLSRNSAYRVKRQLEEMGLIFGKTLGGRRFEWSIGWANVWDLHEQWKQNPASERTEMDHVNDEETTEVCSTSETASSIGGTSGSIGGTSGSIGGTSGFIGGTSGSIGGTSGFTSETSCPTSETHIRKIRSTSFSTSFSTSSSSVDGGDDDDAVKTLAVRLLDCGVTRVGPTIEIARHRGMTIDQIHAVIDHFTTPGNSPLDSAEPARWSPNVLVERLTAEHMHLAKADQGWFGDNPEWLAAEKRKAQQTVAHQQAVAATQQVATQPAVSAADAALESAHGATLDAMTVAERKALLQFAAERSLVTPFWVRSIVMAGADAHLSKLYRKSFLEALKARSANE